MTDLKRAMLQPKSQKKLEKYCQTMKVPEGPLSFERLRFPYKGYCDLCKRGLEGEAKKPIIEWQLDTGHAIYLLCDGCKKALSRERHQGTEGNQEGHRPG